MVNKPIRPPYPHDRSINLQFAQSFEHRAAEPTHQDMIFKGNDHADAARILGDQFAIPSLSAALMLRRGLGMDAEAAAIESAIDRALADGLRTRDLGGSAGTREATQAVLSNL